MTAATTGFRGNLSQGMERVHCQGGIRIPTENSNKLGTKDGEIPFLLSPRQLLPADQDKNENENRFCA
jgi:hypothetical protein